MSERIYDSGTVNHDMVYCPIFERELDEGYCWELCNIATDEILLYGDQIKDWDEAQEICKECGRYEDRKLKLRYVGESFGTDCLTNGKIYDAADQDGRSYCVVDDSGKKRFYSKINPAPSDGSSNGGVWEIVEVGCFNSV